MRTEVQSIKVEGFSWVGIKTENFNKTVGFYRDIMGIRLIWAGNDIAIFQLPSGQRVEVIGPKSKWAVFHDCPVFALDVEDIQAARAELEEQGIEFTSEIEQNSNGGAFCYFIGPDGFQYSLSQPAKAGN